VGRRHGRLLYDLVGRFAAEVDTAHALALEHGMTVTHPPTNEVSGVREFHLRHLGGHTFRVGAGTGEA
jgi:hypothetical protein